MGRRLAHNMRYILNKQRKDGRKATEAHHGATEADYYHIYSDKSLKTHQDAATSFCKWADDNGINRIDQISHDVVGRYCLYLQKHGYSAWTMKAGITAINHIMVYTGHWNKKEVFTASRWNDAHKGNYNLQMKRKNRGEIMNNRRLTAAEWRKENSRLYSNNRRLIDTVRAFGLRRSEACHVSQDKYSIMANSFVECNGRLYCFVPYGKGGRPRFATCRRDMEKEMRRLYQPRTVKSIPTEMEDIKAFRDTFMKKNRENFRKNNYVFDGKVSGDLRFHIQRQEYAQVRLAEEFHDKGRRNNKQKTINNTTGNITAFKAVANDLGHGRIDVLGNYLSK